MFITQAPHKFNLRTLMLYVAERSGSDGDEKSVLTGLRAGVFFLWRIIYV